MDSLIHIVACSAMARQKIRDITSWLRCPDQCRLSLNKWMRCAGRHTTSVR